MIYGVVLSLVVAVLCGVTLYKTISTHSRSDFFVAGRKLAWPVLVFTLIEFLDRRRQLALLGGECLLQRLCGSLATRWRVVRFAGDCTDSNT